MGNRLVDGYVSSCFVEKKSLLTKRKMHKCDLYVK